MLLVLNCIKCIGADVLFNFHSPCEHVEGWSSLLMQFECNTSLHPHKNYNGVIVNFLSFTLLNWWLEQEYVFGFWPPKATRHTLDSDIQEALASVSQLTL